MSTRILSATPDSAFTFNATVTADDHVEVAKLKHKKVKEEGAIIITIAHPEQSYKITHAAGTGTWKMYQVAPHHVEEPLIVARKSKWCSDSMQIELEGQLYKMSSASLWKSDYKVVRLDSDNRRGRRAKVGELRTQGIAQRTFQISFAESIRIELPLFCYWLASLFNKRNSFDLDVTDLF